MGRHSSKSPDRAHVSPRRRSPSRREKSPARHRSSKSDKPSTRARSRSPARRSLSRREKSPKRARSRSPAREKHAISRSPVRQKTSNRTKSPKQEISRPPLSPPKEKPSSRMRSPTREKPRSSVSPSPSPRSKRLKRVTAERDAQKGNEREQEKNSHGRKVDREEKDLPKDKKDRRSERDAVGNGSRSRRGRSDSPPDRHHRGQRGSRSPDNRRRNERTNSRDSEERNEDSDSVAKMKAVEETLDAKEKQKPSFELSGKLAAETNRVRGVTLLFNEPAEARKPEIRWRLYVFKGGEALTEPLYVHRQSCYLFGRERRVADIPTDHPSCSKQHAVLQYRQVEEENPDGTMSKRVRPYVMDLGSTNGTFINENQMEPQRYYELKEKDTIKFGNSSREYVLLHENSSG